MPACRLNLLTVRSRCSTRSVRLGLSRRGSALVGETFDSNTINLAVGVVAPALLVRFAGLSGTAEREAVW